MENAPDDKRTASFICELAYKDKNTLKVFSGIVKGRIGFEIKGDHGFGYDPIFIPDGYDKTFGELGKSIKDKISHRAAALKLLSEWIKKQ